MSAAARKWLDRQRVEGATLNLVLRVLADAADKNGRVNLSQPGIATRAGIQERATRGALSVLDQARVISRTRRSDGGSKGRTVDLIHLSMDAEFSITKDAIKRLKTNGATGTKCRKQIVGQPARKAVAPRPSRVEYNKLPDLHGRIHNVSGRIWQEKKYSSWRARVRLGGLDLDVGRYETEIEATGALRGALADVEYTLGHKAGCHPTATLRSDVDFTSVSDTLPGRFSERWKTRFSYEGCAI
jgi:hypothetical protein